MRSKEEMLPAFNAVFLMAVLTLTFLFNVLRNKNYNDNNKKINKKNNNGNFYFSNISIIYKNYAEIQNKQFDKLTAHEFSRDLSTTR